MHAGGRLDERCDSLPAHVSVEVVDTVVGRLRGLLGRAGFDGEVLLAQCNDIHTFGMQRFLDVAFVSERGTVLAVYRAVPPRCRLRHPNARGTLERFALPGDWYHVGDSMVCGAWRTADEGEEIA